jgi:SAM-dependent methyltransferase
MRARFLIFLMTTFNRIRKHAFSAGLRGIQAIAARLAGPHRSGPRPSEEHTASDLLVAHRMAARVEAHSRVLDVGCGSGHWLRKLRMFREIDATGVDLAPPPSAEGVTLLPYDGRVLPFPDASFDVTLFGYVLHHVGRDHARRLLEEARRVTRSRIFLLEDSMPTFGVFHRIRNRCHRLETEMAYSEETRAYVPPDADSMFLTHTEWARFLGAVPGVASTTVLPLGDLHRLPHHTLFVAELDCSK